MSNRKIETPPSTSSVLLSYPAPYVLLVTINRPQQLNCIPFASHWYMHRVFQWFDREPTLRVAVVTGAGYKAFCAGQDLIELGQQDPKESEEKPWQTLYPPSGFAGMSRRAGKKPIIAAVNGFALGGGFEILLNSDMTIASPKATFGLPEALRGVYAAGGGLPRLVRNVGLPIASEIAMIGRTLSAEEALRYNLVNVISSSPETCLSSALVLAEKLANISPDAIIVTRAGLREAWETGSIERGHQLVEERFKRALFETNNMSEGLAAFREKRKPIWMPSKL